MKKYLHREATVGLAWTSLGAIAGRALQFALDIILSRLLLPEDFGLIAIGIAVVGIAETVTETGFWSALVQKEDDVHELLDPAWSIELLKTLGLFAAVFLLGPALGRFYRTVGVVRLVRVLSFVFLLRGLRNVGIVYFRKNLQFHKQVILEILPIVAQVVVVVPLALFVVRSVWALVAGIYVRRAAELALSYLLHPYRPRWNLHAQKGAQLFAFGKWILGVAVISALHKYGIVLFIGRYFDLEVTGFYNRAEILSTYIFALLAEVIWKVGYPVFSKLQTNRTYLAETYADTMTLVAFVGVPLAGVLLALGTDIAATVLSQKWLYSGHIAAGLGFVGLLSLLSCPSLILLQAVGSPNLVMKASLGSLAVLLILIVPLCRFFGIEGLIATLLSSGAFALVYGIVKVRARLRQSFAAIEKSLVLALGSGVLSFAGAWFVRRTITDGIGLLLVAAFAMAGSALYVALFYVGDKATRWGILSGFAARQMSRDSD